jgi:hypothetical protein
LSGLKWIYLAESVDVVATRIGDVEPLNGFSHEFRAQGLLISALRHGLMIGMGQFGDNDTGFSPEYQPIPDGWWAWIAIVGTVREGRWNQPPFDITVIDWPTSTIRWTKGSEPPVTTYIRNIRLEWADLDRLLEEKFPIEDAAGVRRKEPLSSHEVFRTGFAGRPSGKHLIETEMQRRAESGELNRSCAAEADELAEWYKLTQPGAPSLKAKTIRNSLGELHRRLAGKIPKLSDPP